MAIFVHNTPANAIGQAPPPGPDTFIQTLNQVRRDREAQENKKRDQDISESRYQDYNRFRREDLAERKGVEDRLAGERKDALVGAEEDDINRAEFGHRQLRQGMKLHENDYAIYTQNVNRHTADLAAMGLNEAQIRSFIDGTATPPDTIKDKVATLKRAVGLRQGVATKANQDVDQYNREFGLGVVLGINENSGKMALSAPYIPNRRLSKPPATPSTQQYGTGVGPSGIERQGSGTGEGGPMSIPMTQPANDYPSRQQLINRQYGQPPGQERPPENMGLLPVMGRSAAEVGGNVISGIGEYGRNAASAAGLLAAPAYRAIFSRQPGEPLTNPVESARLREHLNALTRLPGLPAPAEPDYDYLRELFGERPPIDIENFRTSPTYFGD